MNIKILPAANEDLVNGYQFYEQQSPGLGGYFLDSLFSDIDSLLIYSLLIEKPSKNKRHEVYLSRIAVNPSMGA